MSIWGFIALIIIVAIMFGVTLHEAFWGIIAAFGVLCAIGWGFGTKSGKTFVKWACIILGFIIGGVLTYQGIVKKTGDQKQYNADLSSCKNDNWRYESAKVYYNAHSSFYYDENKVNSIYNNCIENANKNSKARNEWWMLEAGAGVMVILFTIAVIQTKEQKTK